eukprot:gene12193-biopygen1890
MRTVPGARKVGPDDRMGSGSSLAFQRLSRDILPFILSVRWWHAERLAPPMGGRAEASTGHRRHAGRHLRRRSFHRRPVQEHFDSPGGGGSAQLQEIRPGT